MAAEVDLATSARAPDARALTTLVCMLAGCLGLACALILAGPAVAGAPNPGQGGAPPAPPGQEKKTTPESTTAVPAPPAPPPPSEPPPQQKDPKSKEPEKKDGKSPKDGSASNPAQEPPKTSGQGSGATSKVPPAKGTTKKQKGAGTPSPSRAGSAVSSPPVDAPPQQAPPVSAPPRQAPSSSSTPTRTSGAARGAGSPPPRWASRTPATRVPQGSRRMLASPARFVARPGRRGGTTLLFSLSKPGRLNFVVLDQKCRRIGSFSRVGRKGVNRIRFSGRLRGQALAPGTYTLVPSLVRGQKRRALARITVRVVPANRRLSAAERVKPLGVQCTGALRAAGGASGQRNTSGSPTSAGSSGPDIASSSRLAAGGGPGAVAGISKTVVQSTADRPAHAKLAVVSAFIPEDAPAPLFLAVLALITMGLGSLLLVAFLLRFLRGSWNP